MKTISKMDILKIKLQQTPNYKMTSEDQIVAHLACVWHLREMGYTGSVKSAVDGILRAILNESLTGK